MFGVVVFKASMHDCRGTICHGLYVHCAIYELIWCNGFPEIYETYGVMVFQRSMLNWRRGWGQSAHGYMCIMLYLPSLGVAVFKASMLNCRGQSAMGICALCYI